MTQQGPARPTFDAFLWRPTEVQLERWTSICRDAVAIGQSFHVHAEQVRTRVERGDKSAPLVAFSTNEWLLSEERGAEEEGDTFGQALARQLSDGHVLHLVDIDFNAPLSRTRRRAAPVEHRRRTRAFEDPEEASDLIRTWLASLGSSGTAQRQLDQLAWKVETAEAAVLYLHSVIDAKDAEIARLTAELAQMFDLVRSLGAELLKAQGADPVSTRHTGRAILRVVSKFVLAFGLGHVADVEGALQLAERIGVPVPHAEAAATVGPVSPSGHRWNADDDVVIAARQSLERLTDLIEFADSCPDDSDA